MVGQDKLLNKFKSYTLQTLPHTIMLVGEEGCGKHTLVHEVAVYFDLDTIIISNDTTAEQLAEYQQSPTAKLYVIAINALLEKQQNQFLKFIEEPSKNTYVILLATSEIGILQTILNRCLIFHFEEYSKAQLQLFSKSVDDLAYIVCKTPGQLINIDYTQLQPMYNVCLNIINNINLYSLSQTVGCSCMINGKEDYSKFDSVYFFRLLLYTAFQDYIKTNNIISYRIYTFTTKYLQRLLYKNIVKDALFTNYFIALKEEIDDGN